MALTKVIGDGLGTLTGNADFNGDLDVDGTTNLDSVDIDGNLDVTGASNSVVTLIKPQGALADNNDNAGLYVLHQGTAGTGLRVRTDNALTGSNFAHVLVNNASASINAFQVSQYGSGLIAKFDKSGTTAMQIDNSGRVTKPLQTYFSVGKTGTTNNISNSGYEDIVLDDETFDIGGNFASNVFTAPITGKYHFSINMRLDNVDVSASYYNVQINTSNRTHAQLFSRHGTDINYENFMMTVVADMDVNDTAKIQIFQNGGASQTDINSSTRWYGYLLG